MSQVSLYYLIRCSFFTRCVNYIIRLIISKFYSNIVAGNRKSNKDLSQEKREVEFIYKHDNIIKFEYEQLNM